YLCSIRRAFKNQSTDMRTISTETNLADAILQNHNLLRVIGRFDIQPGFGDVTVGEICHKKDIDPVFMVVILNSFLDESYFPAHDLTGFSLKQLVRYLQKTHDYYLNHQIPYIQELIDRLCSGQQPENPGLKVVNRFFAAYCRELNDHIMREEKVTFPYVLGIENRFNHPEESETGIPDYTIQHYETEHDNVEEKLNDLKNIMIKYLPQPFDFDLVNRITAELYWLEKDLNEHSRIEDKIMIPKVRMMETELKLNRR
ncbi:hemerythrin domain-containing protein, partial [Lentimicrobium sp.]|uniref:hemerythrin domain-containing protein n=2 Tax=Lentimicrobium sp. TaxID=2034841 RepID=UPI00345E1BB0